MVNVDKKTVAALLAEIASAIERDESIADVVKEHLEAAWEEGYEAAQDTVAEWYQRDPPEY